MMAPDWKREIANGFIHFTKASTAWKAAGFVERAITLA